MDMNKVLVSSSMTLKRMLETLIYNWKKESNTRSKTDNSGQKDGEQTINQKLDQVAKHLRLD